MRTGIATVPLDYGRCPRWLFERMTRLGRGITVAIVEEFGSEEMLKRLSDPIWFQSLGCVMGFDWNSSGLTVTTMGALKEAVRGLETDLGFIFAAVNAFRAKLRKKLKTGENIWVGKKAKSIRWSMPAVWPPRSIRRWCRTDFRSTRTICFLPILANGRLFSRG